jgi:5-methylcytosine-specific restriction endonuclease McrBC regulatory subunit McrC
VDFDTLFEEYLRNILRLERQRLGYDFSVLDGNREGKKSLFDGKPQPKAQPDVVIVTPSGDASLVVEVKYKSAPDRSDYNQAITYAAAYRLNTVVIAHQSMQALDNGLLEIGRVGAIRLLRYGVALDSDDLRHQERSFAEAMFRLAGNIEALKAA